MKYLDSKADLTFKKIFGEHKDLLMSFLNALLPLKEGQVVESVHHFSLEQKPNLQRYKYTIIEVICQDNQEQQFIVQIQSVWISEFKHRILYDTIDTYYRQIKRGQLYETLMPVYTLSLIADTFSDSQDYYHHYATLRVDKPEAKLDVYFHRVAFHPKAFKKREAAYPVYAVRVREIEASEGIDPVDWKNS